MAGFVIDVCLRGVLEEVGSLIVILRLWRVIKIIEELGESAEEQMDALSKRIGQLETENSDLKQELHSMKSKQDRASGMSSRD